jgi:hypothetical protein
MNGILLTVNKLFFVEIISIVNFGRGFRWERHYYWCFIHYLNSINSIFDLFKEEKTQNRRNQEQEIHVDICKHFDSDYCFV